MIIPKEYKLFGHTYTIKWNDKLCCNNDNSVARVDYKSKQIQIKPSSSDFKINQTELEQTYLHEMIHSILAEIGSKEQSKDETFVDLFANALHQVLTTGKGELK